MYNFHIMEPLLYLILPLYKNLYKVVISGTVEVPLYENYTLNINVGDNIVWVNDDPTDIITIVSEQKLWKNDEVVLGHIGSQFNYTFDEIGTYTFYIKQYQGFPKQTIIVSNSNIVPILTDTVPTHNESITTPVVTTTTPISTN